MSKHTKYGDLDDILSPEKASATPRRRAKRPTPALGAMQGQERPVSLTESLKAEKQAAQLALKEAQDVFKQQKAQLISQLEEARQVSGASTGVTLMMPVSQQTIEFSLKDIPADLIDVAPENERIQSFLDEISLSDILPSIQAYGQQKPGMLRLKPNGRYELIEGSRRLAAVKLLGRRYKALVGPVPDEDVRALGEIENQHKDVSAFEKAKAYQARIEQGEFNSWTQLGSALGISSSHIARYKACVELDEIFVRILPSPSDMPLSYGETVAKLLRKNAQAVKDQAKVLLAHRKSSLQNDQLPPSAESVILALKQAAKTSIAKPTARNALNYTNRDGSIKLKHSVSRRTGSNKFELEGVSEDKLERIRDFMLKTLSLNVSE